MESVVADVNDRPIQNLEHIRAFYTQEEIQKPYPHFPHLTPKEAQELTESAINIDILATTLNSNFIGRNYWRDKAEYERMRSRGNFKGSSLVLVGALHTITNIRPDEDENPKAYPAFKYMGENPSIATTPKSVIDRCVDDFDILRTSATPDFGVWVEGKHDSKGDIFLAHGPEDIMREIFGDVIEEVPMKLADLSAPKAAHPIPQRRSTVV
jgi:hypothetical protein